MNNYLKIYTFYINNSSITHPRPTSSLSASRLPWCAAQSVGVIPSSSGAFRSLRVASFSRCRWPSRAARWYLSFMAAAEPTIPVHGWSFGGCCVGEVSRALPLEQLQTRQARAVAMGRPPGKATPTSSQRTPERWELTPAVTHSWKLTLC